MASLRLEIQQDKFFKSNEWAFVGEHTLVIVRDSERQAVY